MKVVRLFRTLAFQPDGKDIERGPQARGTLAILEPECVADRYNTRFIRDVDNDVMEMEIDNFNVFSGVPANINVVLILPDGKRHTFIAYRELPAAESTRFLVIHSGVNSRARTS
jgi:hypothetical protein